VESEKKIVWVVPSDLDTAAADIDESRIVSWRATDGTVIELHDGRAEADK
jgi:hypothetical protein